MQLSGQILPGKRFNHLGIAIDFYEGQEYVMKHDDGVFNRVCNVVCHEIVQQSPKLLGIEVKRFHHGARRDMTFGWFHHEIGLLSGRRACQYSLT